MKKVYIILIFLLVHTFFKVTANAVCPDKITILIPKTISITIKEIMPYIPNDALCKFKGTIQIILYAYTSGEETISYKTNKITYYKSPGYMKVLIKIKHQKTLKRVYFIKATGNTKQEILTNFMNKLILNLK